MKRTDGYQLRDLVVETDAGPLPYTLHLPDAARQAPAPALLLTFSSTRHTSFVEPPYDLPARAFAAAGHYVVSFDLPNHGRRVDEFGTGIDGFSAAVAAGYDPFARFVADGQAVIDACLQQGAGSPARVVACGVSRAAYCALRLTAADRRIRAVAGIAPVIDWRRLREFAPIRDEPVVAALDLLHWSDRLIDRGVYLAIGNRDERVGTDRCVQFAHALYAAAYDDPAAGGECILHVVDSPGHSLADEWRADASSFLLGRLAAAGQPGAAA